MYPTPRSVLISFRSGGVDLYLAAQAQDLNVDASVENFIVVHAGRCSRPATSAADQG
jgi:hypothetical protein